MYDFKFYQACMGANTTSLVFLWVWGQGEGDFSFSSCVWCGEWNVHFPLGHSTLHPSFSFSLLLGGWGFKAKSSQYHLTSIS